MSSISFGPIALAAEPWRRALRASLAPVALAAALAALGLAAPAEPGLPGAALRLWVRELAPLVAALVAAARLGAALAGELGAMRATDQIDALVTLAGDVRRHLVAPRVLAAAAALPALAAIADAVGLATGFGLASLSATPPRIAGAVLPTAADLLTGLARASLFGVVLAAVACKVGLATRGGAREVGRAAARSASASLLAVLALEVLLRLVAPA